MKGLIVRSPWIEMLLSGEKTWEIRSSRAKIRGEIALIKSGTGLIFGAVELTDAIKLSLEQYGESEVYHRIPKDNLRKFPYKNTYAWVVKNPRIFEEPIPYAHPQGAVIWVDLSENDDLNKKI